MRLPARCGAKGAGACVRARAHRPPRPAQVALLEEGKAGEIVQETRLWDEGRQCTFSMRKKEGLADYRYFPEPDLPPLVLSEAYVEQVRVRVSMRGGRGPGLAAGRTSHLPGNYASRASQSTMPELPAEKRARYQAMGLSRYDSLVLSDDVGVAAFFDAVLAAGAPAKPAANWVMGDVMGHCNEARTSPDQLPMAPAALAEMISLIDQGVISGKIGKEILPALLAGEGNGGVRALVEARGMVQISDESALQAIVDGVLQANPKQLEQYRGGKTKLQGFFVGQVGPCPRGTASPSPHPNTFATAAALQVMKESKGRANPAELQRILMERLNEGASS